ncbi:MAG: polysulfide reductase NrfD [Deltaproteobacteria bacterium]|nr:polysulfide reductase NrfD [Deltaproteobacteria bacterium]
MTRNTKILWALWIILALMGGIGIFERLTMGERLAAYTSYVPWGMWVAAYIYFIGLSAGAFLLSSLVYVFGVHKLERIAKLALFVAAITLVMSLLTIWFDLGHMERNYEVFTRPQFHSMMAWMVWLYSAYFALLLGELYYALRRDVKNLSPREIQEDDRKLKRLATIGIPLAIAFHGGVGALFGTVSSRPFWHSSIYPIMFLVGALLSGGALMTFIVSVIWPEKDEAWLDLLQFLGKIVLGFLLFDLLLEWAEYSIPLWYGVGPEADLVKFVLFGPFWYVHWIVHILFGVAIPVYLLTWKRDARSIGIASALVAVTFFAIRLNLVIPGLVTPELRGLEHAYVDPIGNRLSYHYIPSFFEWQVLMGVVALGLALFYFGQRYLPLMQTLNNREVSK